MTFNAGCLFYPCNENSIKLIDKTIENYYLINKIVGHGFGDDQTALSLAIHQLKLENNFTESELKELTAFTFENTYQNENIIQTDSMTAVEKQEVQLELYEQAKNVLGRVSQPRYEINVDLVN